MGGIKCPLSYGYSFLHLLDLVSPCVNRLHLTESYIHTLNTPIYNHTLLKILCNSVSISINHSIIKYDNLIIETTKLITSAANTSQKQKYALRHGRALESYLSYNKCIIKSLYLYVVFLHIPSESLKDNATWSGQLVAVRWSSPGTETGGSAATPVAPSSRNFTLPFFSEVQIVSAGRI